MKILYFLLQFCLRYRILFNEVVAFVFFANAAVCAPDGQGRIFIPARLRAYAKLEKEVVINGMNQCLNLRNPARWDSIEESGLDPDNLADIMEELGF